MLQVQAVCHREIKYSEAINCGDFYFAYPGLWGNL